MGAEGAVVLRWALSSLLPPTGFAWLALLALLLGLAWRRRRMAAGVVAGASLVALLLMSTSWAGGVLIDSLERRAGPAIDREAARALARGPEAPGAVVVLGAGIRTDERDPLGPQSPRPLTLERLRAGARIATWSGLPVAVSGGSPLGALRPEAAVMADSLAADFRGRARWVEDESLDTASSARHSARMLREAGIDRIILVTHAYHMPRARATFETAGFKVDAAPIGFLAGHGARRTLAFVPGLPGLQLATLAMHEWLGIAWYRFNGYIERTP